MNPSGRLPQFQRAFSEFWTARDARERMMLTVAAAAVAAGLSYALLFQPALTGREQLNKNLPALRQQVALVQALSREAASLSGKSAPAITAPTKENIEAALARKGLKPQNMVLTGDLVRVQLDSVSFAGMLGWLDEMQRTMLLSAVEANISAPGSPDMVNATLTLRRQKND